MDRKFFVLLISILTGFAINIMAFEIKANGASLGIWTMDFDAAKKLANTRKTPILLEFSRSDFYRMSKIMRRSVFLLKKWKDYAKKNLVLVSIDCTKNKSTVPEKYKTINNLLIKKYQINHFPTYLVLDDNGETVLGKLNGERNSTPKIFIRKLEELFIFREDSIKKYVHNMPYKKRKEYIDLIERYKKVKINYNKLRKQFFSLNEKIKDFRVKIKAETLSPNRAIEFNKLNYELKKNNKKLNDWLSTDPERTEVNINKYINLINRIRLLKFKISKF